MLKGRAKPSSKHVPGGLPVPPQMKHKNHSRNYQQFAKNNNVGKNLTKKVDKFSQSSSSLPNPGIIRPRVKVHAGDKCVRAKTRQARTNQAYVQCNEPCLQCVQWSDKAYSLHDLVETFKDKLPIIAKVKDVGRLRSQFGLDENQVFQLHSYGYEQRIRVEVDKGTINMPINYPVQVYYKEGDVEERSSLADIVTRYRLPLSALVISIDESSSVNNMAILGRHIHIKEMYQELFVRINTITDGWLDFQGISVITSWFGATFNVAEGMRGASEADWSDFCGMFARSVRHLNFGLLLGYEGIIVEDDGNGSLIINNSTPLSSNPVYANIVDRRSQTLEPKASTSFDSGQVSHMYENLSGQTSVNRSGQRIKQTRTESNGEASRVQKRDVQRSREQPRPKTVDYGSQKRSDGSNHSGAAAAAVLTGFDPPTAAGLPDLVSSRTQSADVDDDVEEMFQSVLDVAQEQQDKKDGAPLQKARTGQSRNEFSRQSNRYRNSSTRDSTPNRQSATNFANGSVQPSSSSARERSKSPVVLNSVKVEVHREPSPTPAGSDVTSATRDVRALARQFESGSSSSKKNRENIFGNRLSEGKVTPKAIVAPTPKTTEVRSENLSTPEPKTGASTGPTQPEAEHRKNAGAPRTRRAAGEPTDRQRDIQSLDDVPNDVSTLSVDDVINCLGWLNMERHAAEFRSRNVDGRLLVHLKETNLINEYKFTPFNASKLMRFVRGWRPKGN